VRSVNYTRVKQANNLRRVATHSSTTISVAAVECHSTAATEIVVPDDYPGIRSGAIIWAPVRPSQNAGSLARKSQVLVSECCTKKKYEANYHGHH
jgi:hypothetical protein